MIVFDTACNVQSESLANALITQTVELRKRPEAPDLRIDDSYSVFVVFEHGPDRARWRRNERNIFRDPESAFYHKFFEIFSARELEPDR